MSVFRLAYVEFKATVRSPAFALATGAVILSSLLLSSTLGLAAPWIVLSILFLFVPAALCTVAASKAALSRETGFWPQLRLTGQPDAQTLLASLLAIVATGAVSAVATLAAAWPLMRAVGAGSVNTMSWFAICWIVTAGGSTILGFAIALSAGRSSRGGVAVGASLVVALALAGPPIAIAIIEGPLDELTKTQLLRFLLIVPSLSASQVFPHSAQFYTEPARASGFGVFVSALAALGCLLLSRLHAGAEWRRLSFGGRRFTAGVVVPLLSLSLVGILLALPVHARTQDSVEATGAEAPTMSSRLTTNETDHSPDAQNNSPGVLRVILSNPSRDEILLRDLAIVLRSDGIRFHPDRFAVGTVRLGNQSSGHGIVDLRRDLSFEVLQFDSLRPAFANYEVVALTADGEVQAAADEIRGIDPPLPSMKDYLGFAVGASLWATMIVLWGRKA